MAKMNLRSSLSKDPKKESPLKSQGVTKNPSLELCRFTDPEIDWIRHCFRKEPSLDPLTLPRRVTAWFNYPFSVLTQAFFTLTGMCFIQAMLMMWRVFYTHENIIEQEGVEIGMSELSQLYNLVSHGSHRFLFKHKPGQAYPILKTTKNDSNWRNQFFFVKRDSIPSVPSQHRRCEPSVGGWWGLTYFVTSKLFGVH
ncbi:hypothetical protein Hanom_Chr02g00105871 [Helianthus anomalus]